MGRTFQAIADEIYLNWPGPGYRMNKAALYLEALQEFDTTDPLATKGGQTARDLVLGFLSTAVVDMNKKCRQLKLELREAAKIEFNVHNNKYKL